MVVTMASAAGLVLVSLAVVLATSLWTAALHLVWRPYAVAKAFRRQGIRGPAYRFFVGNNEETMAMRAATADDVLDLGSHDIIARVMPQYKAWTASYGKVFLSWAGYTPSLCVGDYDMVKHILSNKTGLYGKPNPGPNLLALLGKGLVFSDGDDWARHRRVVHPAFTMDKLKMMTSTMAECAGAMVRPWERRRRRAGGRRRAAFRGAHRRRDLAHGVREQLQGREGGVRGAAGAPVHRLLHHQQRPRPGPRVPPHQDQPPAPAADGEGARHAHGDHPRAAGRRQGCQRLRQRPARSDARGQRVGRRRRAEGGRHEHGRDHRRVQDLLLRGARHHLAPPHLGRLPPRHAPGVAAEAQAGGPPGVRQHGDAAARRRAQQAQAYDNGAVRDAEAVRRGDHDREGGDRGHGARRREDPQGHDHHDTDGDDAPGRGGVGRGRRRVQPGQVPQRRGQGGEAPERDAGLLRGAAVVHRAGLRDAGGQVDAGRDPAPVRVRGGDGVRARAGRVPDAAAQVRAPRAAQALGSVERLPLC